MKMKTLLGVVMPGVGLTGGAAYYYIQRNKCLAHPVLQRALIEL
jgi:hypothetical protein